MAYEYEKFILNILTSLAIKKENIGYYIIADEVEDVYAKAKAFDTFLKYKQHVEKYNNSDCYELERVFQGVMKEYEEDE